MMLKRILLLFFFFTCLSGSQAQIARITDSSGNPISHAVLHAPALDTFLLSNYKGYANIYFLMFADSIYVSKRGFLQLRIKTTELQADTSLLIMKSDGSRHHERSKLITKTPARTHPLQEVTISVSKIRQRRRDIPVKFSQIRQSDIAFQNPQTAADALALSGDVFIQKSQMGGGSPMIRGFSANRVLLTVDGVRMNTAIFRAGNVHNVISIDPLSISHTDIVFGPGSVIYGSDAIGGVMNFFTTEPEFSQDSNTIFSGNAQLRLGSANRESTLHLDFQTATERFASYTSVTLSSFGDMQMGRFGRNQYLQNNYIDRIDGRDTILRNPDTRSQRHTGYDQANFIQKFRYLIHPDWELSYALHLSATTDIPRYDRLIEPDANGQLRNAEWSYGPQLWAMNSLRLEHKKTTAFYDRMRLILAYQFFEESRITRRIHNPSRRTQTENVNALSANLEFEKKWSPKHQSFYGLEGIYNQVLSSAHLFNIDNGQRSPTNTRYPDGSSWQSTALAYSHQYAIHRKLTLQAGARINNYQAFAQFDDGFLPLPQTEAEINQTALTGSTGLTYRPDHNWLFAFNLSTGFRAPNIDDLGKIFDSSPGALVVPNPNLRGEYAYNAEISIARSIRRSFHIEITGFYTILENALVRRDFSINGQDSVMYDGVLSRVEAIQNAASAYVYGIQARAEWSINRHWKLVNTFNYQQGQEELDDGSTGSLRHAPPLFGVSRIQYFLNKLQAEVYVFYNGNMSAGELPPTERGKEFLYAADENGQSFSPAWATLNFKLNWEFMEGVHMQIGVENMTDLRYRPFASGLVAPGRHFILGLRGRF